MSKFMGEGFDLKDFVDFKFFVTPQIIKAIWILASIGGSLGWVVAVWNGCEGFVAFCGIVFGLPIVLLAIRLIFESFMVLFAIVALLRDIRDR